MHRPLRSFFALTLLLWSVAALLGTALPAVGQDTSGQPCGAEPDDADQIAIVRAMAAGECDCASAASNGDYVNCVDAVADAAVADGSLRPECEDAVLSCAAQSTCGRPGFVTCCRTNRNGQTSCSIKSAAAFCKAPPRGTACVGSVPSCCDACGPGGSCPPPGSTTTTRPPTTTTTTASTTTTQPPTTSTTTTTTTTETTTSTTPAGANGTPCTTGSECTSTFCVDSVCCDTACDGTCEACTAVKTGGTDGACAPIPEGMDPDSECPDQGPCGLNGSCDGFGACQFYASGTACNDGLFCNGTDTCNGAGNCNQHSGNPCECIACQSQSCLCDEATDACVQEGITPCNFTGCPCD